MHLTKRGEYGLRALINLGIAHELGYAHVAAGDLCRCGNLPVKFVEQIFKILRASGYVSSKRGKHGGYAIAKPMAAIRMGDLVRVMDGPLSPIACASRSAYAPCTCPDEEHCGLRMLMIDVRNAIANILDRYTLADVVEVTLRKIRRDNVPYYFLQNQQGAPGTRPQAATAMTRNPDPAEGFLAAFKS